MTKQEYEARMSELYFNRNLQQINKLLLKCAAKDKYISSLEAENAELIGRIEYIEAKTEKIHNTMYGHGSCNDSAEYVLDNLLLDIVQLNAKNAELERLNSVALERLSKHSCPPYILNYGQPCNDSNDCVACWREYLGKKLKGEANEQTAITD